MTDAWQQRIEARRPASPPRDVAKALAALPDDDLLRLRALARLRSRGLPGGIAWSDLLHEAVARALSGARPWPPGVPLVAFLAGVMRSLCDEEWRRCRRERALSDQGDAGGDAGHAALDPERACAAGEALAAIDQLFAADLVAMAIIAGLTNGLTAEEIRRHYGLSAMEYDTSRRRMRRALLRHGLAWAWP